MVPLRFLRLKHAHVRQNITYDCKSGVDKFILVKLQAADGGVVSFNDKTVRMVSQVSTTTSLDEEFACDRIMLLKDKGKGRK